MNSYIVYVDDEEMLCELFCMEMEFLGYRALSFSDPFVAQKDLQDKSISLLISDFKMSGMSGWDLIKSLPKMPPSILITGDPTAITDDMRKACLKIQLKPFEFSELLSVIENYGKDARIETAI